MTINPRTYMD